MNPFAWQHYNSLQKRQECTITVKDKLCPVSPINLENLFKPCYIQIDEYERYLCLNPRLRSLQLTGCTRNNKNRPRCMRHSRRIRSLAGNTVPGLEYHPWATRRWVAYVIIMPEIWKRSYLEWRGGKHRHLLHVLSSAATFAHVAQTCHSCSENFSGPGPETSEFRGNFTDFIAKLLRHWLNRYEQHSVR